MYILLSFACSTASNCPAPRTPQANDVPEEEAEAEKQDDADTRSNKDKGTKRKIKSQSNRDNNIEKIMCKAQVEDHPVELALTAIAKQMIRSLDSDEQDDLLDQIQSVSAKYFRERQQRLKRNNVQEAVQSAILRGPPPLTPAGQPVAQVIQQAEIQQMSDDMLVEVGSLLPLEQYNIQYVTAADTGATYMKLN